MPSLIELSKDLLLDLYKEKRLSVKKISQEIGYSPTCVYNNLLRHKIPIISNSQRYRGQPGRHHSEKSRKKIAISKIGDKNPAKRIEVRLKISKANKGRRISEETRQKMSSAQKGRIISWGDKISAVKKRWYASKDGQDFIIKLQQRIKSNNPMFNKSEQIRKRHWTRISDEDKKREIISNFRKARMLQKFPLRDTKIELKMQEELTKRNIDFTSHYPIGDICQPDIVIPKVKLIIQCDGDWWHANPTFHKDKDLSLIQRNNIKRDRSQDEFLRQNGWTIMRFWESEIMGNISHCVDKIEEFLKKERMEVEAIK